MRSFLVLSALLAASGCSNSPAAMPDAGGPTGYGGGCPNNAPAPMQSCSNEGVECEYAQHYEFCTTVEQCVGGQYQPELGYCIPPDADGGACPNVLGGVAQGSSCPTILQCDYTDGRCTCSNLVNGMTVVDAGFTWSCTRTPQGCPDKRPLMGMNCAPEGMVCDYGACSVEDTMAGTPLAVKCKSGIWVRAGCGS